jgi:hypothetical protein
MIIIRIKKNVTIVILIASSLVHICTYLALLTYSSIDLSVGLSVYLFRDRTKQFQVDLPSAKSLIAPMKPCTHTHTHTHTHTSDETRNLSGCEWYQVIAVHTTLKPQEGDGGAIFDESTTDMPVNVAVFPSLNTGT